MAREEEAEAGPRLIFLWTVILIVAAVVYVAYPLWRGRPAAATGEDSQARELLAKKEATYSALKELEFDYALGNLTPQDHRELEEKYKDRAVSILKELEAWGKREQARGGLEEELEEEILRLRRGAKAGVKRLACSRCQAPCQPGDSFCSQCGAPLVKPEEKA